jgi:hypothetical protein
MGAALFYKGFAAPLLLPHCRVIICLMSENGKERFILTKSYEIAYAIFRIAAIMPEKDFAERLRAAGAGMLEAGAVQDYAAARKSLQIAECLVKFAGDTSLMGAANSDTLLREVYVLDAAVIERMNAAKESAIDLAEIFSKPVAAPAQVSDSMEDDQNMSAAANDDIDIESEPTIKTDEDVENEDEPIAAFAKSYSANSEPMREPEVNLHPAIAKYSATAIAHPVHPAHNPASAIEASGVSFIKAEIRQSAILGKIRQSGNCRMKDLQDVLPGCSERTIRYDLQSLLEQKLIERIGNGGPSVFYQMGQMRQPAQGMGQSVAGNAGVGRG